MISCNTRGCALLAYRSPTVQVLAGTAEAIPPPEPSVDVVFVSSAWHWMDPAAALPEIARVLRPGGRLRLIWTGRDRAVDWVAELDRALPRRLPPAGRARHRFTLPAEGGFGEPETATFRQTVDATVGAVVEQLSTYSGMLTADSADRERALHRARADLEASAAPSPVSSTKTVCCPVADLSRALSLSPTRVGVRLLTGNGVAAGRSVGDGVSALAVGAPKPPARTIEAAAATPITLRARERARSWCVFCIIAAPVG